MPINQYHFLREERYYVLKISDMRKYLSTEKQETVRAIAEKINAGRIVDKKNVLQAVVVESDWPEYETVWDMIKTRVTGNQNGDLIIPNSIISQRQQILKRSIEDLIKEEAAQLNAEFRRLFYESIETWEQRYGR